MHKHQDSINSSNNERCELLAKYILQNNATVRATAYVFSLSKSTVHKDVTTRLKSVNPLLFSEVREVLEKNKAERHMRGGNATKLMYLHKANVTKKRLNF